MISEIKELFKIPVFIAFAMLLAWPLQYMYDFSPLYTINKEGTTYYVQLGKSISGNIDGYYELQEWLLERTKEETVIFNLNSYGGDVMSGMIIMNGIALTKAKTIAQVKSTTYSMGTAIACATNEIRFDPYGYLMFHRANSDGKEISNNKLQEAIAQMNQGCIAKGILPQEEFDKLISIQGYEYYYWPKRPMVKSPEKPRWPGYEILRVLK